MTSVPKSLERHDVYYIPTADLSILVENIKFRVHRFFFERESSFFRTMLTPSSSSEGRLPGADDANPIVLESVTATEFAKFVWVFYNPRYSLYDATMEEWEGILTLSHRWFFPEVKQLAVRELQKHTMTPVKRITLYQEHNVDRNLLIPDYAALCNRDDPLSLDEGLELGMETTLRISWGREAARSKRLADGKLGPTPLVLNPEEMWGMVRDIFKITPIEDAAGTPTDDKTTTPTKPKQDNPPPTPAKDVNGSNPGASPTVKTTKEGKKTNQTTKNKLNAKNKKEKTTSNVSGSQSPVAGQQKSPGSGKPVGHGSNAERNNNENGNDKNTKTTTTMDDELWGDLGTKKGEDGDGADTNSGYGETESMDTFIMRGGLEKLHIMTDSPVFGNGSDAGGGLDSTTLGSSENPFPWL